MAMVLRCCHCYCYDCLVGLMLTSFPCVLLKGKSSGCKYDHLCATGDTDYCDYCCCCRYIAVHVSVPLMLMPLLNDNANVNVSVMRHDVVM